MISRPFALRGYWSIELPVLTFTFRAFSRCFYPKQLTTIHTQTAESTMQGAASSSGAVRVRCSCSETLQHSGGRTTNLPVKTQLFHRLS